MLSRALAFVISSLSLCLLLAPSRADAQCGSLTNDCCLPSPTLSPGCSDETCCEAVCAADAYCCDIYWDSVCAFSAALRCPSLCGNASCDLAVSNQTELELCGEGLNDDCFATVEPLLTPGSTVQGTLSAGAGGGGGRDLDWYRLTILEPTAVSLSLRSARVPAAAAILDANCTGNLFAGTDGRCPAEVTACLAAGDYLVLVYATVFDGFPCGATDNRYTLGITGVSGCSTAPPSNDDCVDATVATIGANPFNNIFATTEVSQPSCGLEGLAFTKDVWFSFSATEAGVYEFGTCFAPSTLDTGLEIWNTCPSNGGAILACDDDGCTISSFVRTSRIVYPLTKGQTVLVRLAGLQDASGVGDLVINLFGGAVTCGDPAQNNCCAVALTPGCADETCCNLVCTIDPLCCFDSWDASCVAFAQSLCAVKCADKCALASETALEDEPCGADTNGGCNGGPATVVSIGDTVRGTLWADDGLRDTDWYLLSVSEPTEVTISIRSEFDSFAAFFGIDCEFIASTEGSCPGTRTRCLAPGDYYILALPSGFDGLRCGGEVSNEYTLEITGVPGCSTEPPANDFCSGASVATLGANPVDTIFATTEVSEKTCGLNGLPFTKDVWFTFTAQENAVYTFETCGGPSSFDSGIEVWDGCPAKGGEVIACNDDGLTCQSLASSVSSQLSQGETVFIRIGGFNGASDKTELVVRSGCCGGGCDGCSNPTVVGLGANAFTNVQTFCYFEDGCGIFEGFTSNVNFYQFTPPQTGAYAISTCDSASFDTVISVRTGCNGTILACNNDTAFTECSGKTSRIPSVELEAGRPYIITIGSNDYFGVGAGTLTITPVGTGSGPANDDCANATPVEVGLNSFSNLGATGSVYTFCSDLARSVWYSYTATANGPATISFCETDGGSTAVNTVIAVISECGGLSIACNNDACGLQSKVTFSATCGRTYKIAIGTRAGASPAAGSGTFRVVQAGNCLPPCPADLNGDGSVAAQDLAALLDAWDGPAGDINGDGTTNAQDLAALLTAWGECGP